jgi:hypothetical protein
MERRARIDGIDFWRGGVLCMIFVDHMPGNAFEAATPRNFGFSDAAEAFVFLSGVSIALAYGGQFATGERLKPLRALARRALKLYGAHIGLSLAALAIFFSGAALAEKPALVAVHGRELFVDNPGLGLLGLVSLGHQLGYFNILPLYMILIACAPILLLLAALDWRVMLAGSALFYALVRLEGWNLPNWPAPGAWFFDPLAWQLLFAIGIAVGLSLRRGPFPVSRPLVAASIAIVAASALVVTHGLWSPAGGVRYAALEALRGRLDLDKSQLGLARLIHFLALACLVHASGISERLRGLRLYAPLTLLGRNSLWVFALVSLCSALWQVLAETAPRNFALDAAFAMVGIALIYLAARAVDAAPQGRAGRDPPAAAPAPMGFDPLGAPEPMPARAGP